MDKKLLWKIMMVYLVINGILFPMMEYIPSSVYLLRIFLFCMVGVFVGIYVFHKCGRTEHANSNSLVKNFGIKAAGLFLLFAVYYIHDVGYQMLRLYDNFYFNFLGMHFEDSFTYPFLVMFIYDSFLECFSLLSYILSYYMYGITVSVLGRWGNRIGSGKCTNV